MTRPTRSPFQPNLFGEPDPAPSTSGQGDLFAPASPFASTADGGRPVTQGPVAAASPEMSALIQRAAADDPVWSVRVARRDLIDAIGVARTRATLRRAGVRLEPGLLLVGTADGLSIRSSDAAMDVAAEGLWTSPVIADCPALRRLAPKLDGVAVDLVYAQGRLRLNGTDVPAREV